MTLCTPVQSLETKRQGYFYDFGRTMISNEKNSGGILKNYSQEIDSANADLIFSSSKHITWTDRLV